MRKGPQNAAYWLKHERVTPSGFRYVYWERRDTEARLKRERLMNRLSAIPGVTVMTVIVLLGLLDLSVLAWAAFTAADRVR